MKKYRVARVDEFDSIEEIVDFQELKGENKMNVSEKLRFLADRADDGKEFEIDRVRYRFNNGKLEVKYSWWMPSQLLFGTVISHSVTLTPNWTFSEDARVVEDDWFESVGTE